MLLSPSRLSSATGNVAHPLYDMLSVSRPGSCRLVEVVLVVGNLSTSTAPYSRFSRLVIGVAALLYGNRLGSTMSPSVVVEARSGNKGVRYNRWKHFSSRFGTLWPFGAVSSPS